LSARALAVVFFATTVPDLDAIVALFLGWGHRSLLHNVWVPLLFVVVIALDTRLGTGSRIRARWGSGGVRVAWTSVAALVLAGLAPDFFTTGINAFFPLYDQFYHLDGRLEYSTERGIVQTFVHVGESERAFPPDRLGVEPLPGGTLPGEKLFPVARTGTQLMLVIIGFVTVTARLWEVRRSKRRIESADSVAGPADRRSPVRRDDRKASARVRRRGSRVAEDEGGLNDD
jgi:hypothetical protein